MKYGVISSLTISVLWALLAIVQLWFSVLTSENFMKITISAAILVGVIVVVSLVVREYLSDKKLKKEGFIDE